MKYIKKNKWVLIPITVFIVVMVFSIIGIVNLVVPNDSKNLYGNRLDGIENNKIPEESITLIKEDIISNENVKNINYHQVGKLVNFIITVNEDTDKVTAENIAGKILSGFDDNIKKFYDFQIFINTEDSENELFPIIGYKHVNSVNIIWTNN